jgi:hypothetical protein
MESEMKKLSTPAKKKKYPNPKQRVAIGLNVCGLSKYEDGGEIKNKLDLYQVTLNFEDDIETIYVGNDKKKAYNKYENFNPKTDIETKYQDRNDIFLILQKSTQTYKFVYDLDEDESIEDYPLEDYFDEDYYWKLIDEGDWEDIETKDILAVNKKSDDLLKEVEE